MADTGTLLDAAVTALAGAPRPGQKAMAQAVAKAMTSERHLAVQAGTGTGKSLAYLVPAIAHAQRTGTTVVVSTATIALQNQLVSRDLPRLADALEPHLDRRPTYAIVKGRSNYLCLNKATLPESVDATEALLEEEDISWLGKHVKRVWEWAEDTETGDRDDLVPGVPDLAWKQVSVTAAECLGAARCPHGEDCFAEQARQDAADVDVVVTNHAMLAIDALADVNILPEHDVVIIDEAHELDGRITSVATEVISPRAVRLAAKRAEKLGASGEDTTLNDAAEDIAAVFATCEAGRWTSATAPVKASLAGLRDKLWSLRQAIGQAPEGEATNAPEKAAERQNLSNHLLELHDAIVRILEALETTAATTVTDVVWLSESSSGDYSLSVAPLSVAGLLHSTLFADNTVVLTSATLTIGGRFDVLAASWGLPKGSWDSLDAGTPFDPARSGILYTAAHLPTPGRDGLSSETLTEMSELILAAGGRTLGLFSSRRAAREAAEALRPRLPFDILLQGDDSTGALVKKFAANENTCLFGTLSLWQGVDVPGKSLSLVVIDRIPFPRPDDPLLQARTEAANEAGRSGFMEVSATHAGLLLAQGTGRLLRSVDDRGVIAVLDNRLVTKRYGGFLQKTLLPYWKTTDPQVVRGALKRLVAS